MKKNLFIVLLSVLAVLVSFTSCNDEAPEKPLVLESIKLSSDSESLYVGGTVELKASVVPEGVEAELVWESSNTDIASVKDGVVTGNKVGVADIYCRAKGSSIYASCKISVIEDPSLILSIALDKTSLELTVGDSNTIKATILPETAASSEVEWSSSNKEIVSVKDGEVTALATGSATITCKAKDSDAKAECVVTVSEPKAKVYVNLVGNSSLEKKDGNGLPTVFGGDDKNGPIYDSTEYHSGSASYKMPSNATAKYLWTRVLGEYDATKAVTAGVWVKLTNVEDRNKIRLVVERHKASDNSVDLEGCIKKGLEATTEWQRLSLDIPESEEEIGFIVLKIESDGDTADFYFDDFELYTSEQTSINLLKNGNFEEGNTGWGNLDGNITEDSELTRNNSKYAVVLSEKDKDLFNSTAWYKDIFPNYTGKNSTQAQVWMKKTEGTVGTIVLRAEIKEGVADVYTNVSADELSSTEWKQITLDISAFDKEVSEFLFHLQTGSDFSGTVYFDDAALMVCDN